MGEFGAACSGFVCDNPKLREFVSSKVSPMAARQYNASIADIRAEAVDADGMVMKKEDMSSAAMVTNRVNTVIVTLATVAAIVVMVVVIRRRRNKFKE